MDFKSLINKLDSMEAPPETPKAPTLPQTIKLNEDAELRVLAGTSSILEEAKKMKKDEEKMKEASKTEKKEKVEEGGLDMNLVKAAQKGQEGKPVGKPDAESDKNVRKKYGYRMDGEPAERDDDPTKQERRGRKRQNTGENIIEDGGEGVEDLMAATEEEYNQPGRHIDNLQDVMNSTFDADDSPEFERARDIINRYLEFVTNTDIDHYDDDEDPDHEDEPMIGRMRHGNIQKHIREYDLGDYLVSAISELKKVVGKGESFNRRAFESKFAKMVEAKKTARGKKAEDKMDEASYKSSKKKNMKEAAKPDFLDVDKDGDKKEPMKKAAKEAGKGGEKKETKGVTAAQKKLPPGLQKAIAKKKGKTESVRRSKRVVAESIDMKLTFRDMIKLVQESGGQQQIDPVDKTLFAWATRVAQQKFNESTKAEVYAGLVYERMGGRFEMFDVLAENQK